MTTGEKIRILRMQAGLSQAQLAEQLYVSRAAVAKWENDNGIPDVENLKALAAYFNCDIDSLLDEYKEIEIVVGSTEDRIVSICNKNCAICPELQTGRCAGCRNTAENSIGPNCPIATCCRRFRHSSCADCSINQECETLRMRGSMPVSIEESKQAKTLAYSRIRDNASFLRNYVWAHFWLFVPYVLEVVAGFIFQARPTGVSFLKYFDVVLTLLCGIANVYILLRLTKVEKGFLKTGLLFAVYFVVDLLATVLPVTSYVPEITTLPASLVGIYATYMEYGNYSNLMRQFDREMSEKWFRLRKFYIIYLAGIAGSLLLTAIIPIVGALLAITCLFGLLGVSILTFIYRYKSAKEICVYGS